MRKDDLHTLLYHTTCPTLTRKCTCTFVFTPKHRAALIDAKWEDDLFKYISGIVARNNHKLIAINGMPDHIHLLVGFRTSQSMADFMQDVKADSSQWINKQKFCNVKFEWQSGYGVFSYSKSQIPRVARYIENQKEHHRKKAFLDEYRKILQKFEVEYQEQYLFHPPN